MTSKPTDGRRPIAANRRARHEYEILEELECGIELRGTEVKSLRAGRCSLPEGYGTFRKSELWLLGVNIPEYTHGNLHNHEPTRPRKLLAHRRELNQWEKRVRERGMSVVPLQIYFQGALVKVTVALVRGKKHYDKRQTQRERDDRRDMDRALSRRR